MSETIRQAFPSKPAPLVSYGLPYMKALAAQSDSRFHASKIYVIVSASLARNTPVLDDLKSTLGDKLAGVRVGMKPHTHWSEILEITADAKRVDADLLVTIGAGSLTDAAKIISLALANNAWSHKDLESMHTSSSPKREHIEPMKVPIVCVPTSLSGGEYQSLAGGTDERTGQKHTFNEPMRDPALVILDPELAKTTPTHVWLSTGVKAVDHCVERLCSLQSNEVADEAGRAGLRKLVPGLIKSKQDPGDVAAVLECQLGVLDAMNFGVPKATLGASHGIAHQLGPVGVGHGETSCILLPAVCKYNYKVGANRERQDAVVGVLWSDPTASKTFKEAGLNRGSADLGDLMDAFIRALGMPRTLKEFGIGEDKLDSIAEHSLDDIMVKTNPAKLDKDGILEILRMVLG